MKIFGKKFGELNFLHYLCNAKQKETTSDALQNNLNFLHYDFYRYY